MRLDVTEAQFQQTVMDFARYRGWLVHHTRVANSERGWRTPISGDAGYPDLTLARRGVVVIAELKTNKGRLTAQQLHWGSMLPGEVYRLWRPSDWPEIMEELM